jgi:hypothetical protein
LQYKNYYTKYKILSQISKYKIIGLSFVSRVHNNLIVCSFDVL